MSASRARCFGDSRAGSDAKKGSHPETPQVSRATRVSLARCPTTTRGAVAFCNAYWGGELISSITADGTGLRNTDWTVHSLQLPGRAGPTWLEFAAAGRSDSYGGYLDAVSLTAVPKPDALGRANTGDAPVPATVWLLGAGLLGLGLGRRARD